ncbi:hypothetical protein F4820DRAFT_443597 [Hypoxylon rubiginosum]|uniref:Uncharacterized protein n=1 Tax=Hypoxylon rubiginosum TaxID=110542 RepID=A0ACB9ZG13_9PEZI|nr:hypothetical protein F4820DRAFT_443597 [Hypoxylon rubiginosum]
MEKADLIDLNFARTPSGKIIGLKEVENLESHFEKLPQRVEFMCSDGGLKQSRKFKENKALLGGLAGGGRSRRFHLFGLARCTPIPDAEVIEKRTQVVVQRYRSTAAARIAAAASPARSRPASPQFQHPQLAQGLSSLWHGGQSSGERG